MMMEFPTTCQNFEFQDDEEVQTEPELLPDLIELKFKNESSINIICNKAYLTIDIRPKDALLSINGTTVRNQTHAEELLRNAKNMSPDDKNLISLKLSHYF